MTAPPDRERGPQERLAAAASAAGAGEEVSPVEAAACPVCLEAVGEGAAGCSQCGRAIHRACAARFALAAAAEGSATLRCPVPDCGRGWPASLVEWAVGDACVSSAERARFWAARAAAEELHAAAGRGGRGALSPRSQSQMAKLGIRGCPRCGSLIQKQAEGLLTGCDKMTCRCGCMFCFSCGVEARPGGVARCRCVGAHHSFIPQSQVLSNYRTIGNVHASGDMDLVRRPRGAASKGAATRLQKELQAIKRDPPPNVHIRCDAQNLLSWSFVLAGPADTPYAGGFYWGQLDVPKDYPFWPPLIRILTPNGRFNTDGWLCRSTLDYHPEGWQPAWNIASILLTLLSILCDDSFSPGAVHPPAADAELRSLAAASLAWNEQHAEFTRTFPEIGDLARRCAAADDVPPASSTDAA